MAPLPPSSDAAVSSPITGAASGAPAALPATPFAVLSQVLRGERLPRDGAEERDVLLELARRKSGRLPAHWLVAQACRVTEGADFAARRAALEALLRRLSFAARDELAVAARPERGRLGRYALSGRARARGEQPALRPYQVEVRRLEPLTASCDCADFLRSSLGACKHVLVVLEDIAAAGRGSPPAAAPPASPQLTWDPVRAWTGPGDRLAGLRWQAPEPPPGSELAGGATDAGGWQLVLHASFEGGRPRPERLGDVESRARLLAALEAATRAVSCEPAAVALVKEELARVERRRAGRAALGPALQHLGTLRRTLYPYQLDGVRRFIEEQRLLLADDMGLGKTTQAIAACHALYVSGRVERGLLIVPAALKAQWQREWQATTDRAPLVLVEGAAAARARLLAESRRGFLLLSYEQLLRDLPSVERHAPELVLLDEAQRLKNWATKSSAYVMRLEPEWRLVLTGTPLENRLEELATLLDWVDDAALAPKWRLGPWHSAHHRERPSERVGARHLDTLRARLSGCLLRRVRREVLSQLPPRSDVRVPVELTPQQREEHDARLVPIGQLLAAGRRRPLRQAEFLRLMQLLTQQRIASNGLALLRFDELWPAYSQLRAEESVLASTCSPKLGELRRVISELAVEQGRKVVVFSQWRKMLRLAHWAVRDVLDEAGLSCAFFTGGESQAARTRNVERFHEDPSARVLLLSDAGGVGLNLQRAASACVNLELPWNPAVLEQRIGRIYRLGQGSPVDVINLVTEQGIEARIAALVGRKRALFEGLFDGTTDAVQFEAPAGFLQDVERLVEPAPLVDAAADVEAEPLAVDASDAGAARQAAALALGDPDDAEPGEPAPLAGAAASEPSERARERDAPAAATSVEAVAVAREVDEPSSRRGEPWPALDVRALLGSLSVTRTPAGGVRLEAPPEAARELLQLLDGLAALLRPSVAGDEPPR